MNLSDAIKKRRSIRKYKTGFEIPDEHIKAILEAAMLAPSACNKRPWEFIVLKSDEAKKKVIDLNLPALHIDKASVGILVCAVPEAQEGSPAVGFYPQDCGAAIENMLLQALDLGYGSCWCGIYPKNERIELFKNTFELSSVPFALVVFGASDEEPEQKGYYDENKVKII